MTVTINPDGAADVTITGPNGYNAVRDGIGRDARPRTGNVHMDGLATDSTFAISGDAAGTFVVADCVIPEVLPRTILPATGTELPGWESRRRGVRSPWYRDGVDLSHAAASRRSAAGVWALANRLHGRSVWTAPVPRLVLSSTDLDRTRRSPLSGWVRRRGDRTGRSRTR